MTFQRYHPIYVSLAISFCCAPAAEAENIMVTLKYWLRENQKMNGSRLMMMLPPQDYFRKSPFL